MQLWIVEHFFLHKKVPVDILDLKLHNPKIFTDSNDVVTSFMASLTAMDWGW